MSIQDIINKIKQDERNIEYTKRNIPPILQVSKSAKILIIGIFVKILMIYAISYLL